jgi:predicted DNA-binding transcriptional regulator AlpA
MQTKEYLIKLLENTITAIKANTTEIDEETALTIAGILAHKVMSKESACKYLNMSRAKFDLYVSEGKLPKGKKRIGFKELCWYQDELDSCLKKLK